MIKLYEPKIYKEDIHLVSKTLKEGWVSGNSPIVKDFENKISGISFRSPEKLILEFNQ